MSTKMIETVEKIASTTPDAEVRACRRIEVGHAVHQGDVYLHRVADAHPRGAELGTRQVAVGTTVGSRHVAEGEGVKVYAGAKVPPSVDKWLASKAGGQVEDKAAFRAAVLGPVVVATGPWALTHPEHAHHSLPAGCWQVTYQVDETTGERVRD